MVFCDVVTKALLFNEVVFMAERHKKLYWMFVLANASVDVKNCKFFLP